MTNALIQILITLPLLVISFQNCENPVEMNPMNKAEAVTTQDDDQSLDIDDQNDPDNQLISDDDSRVVGDESLGEEVCEHDALDSEEPIIPSTSEENIPKEEQEEQEEQEDQEEHVANHDENSDDSETPYYDHQANDNHNDDQHLSLHEICESGDVESAPFNGNFVGKCLICHFPSGDLTKARLIRVDARRAKNRHIKNHPEDFVIKCGR